MADADAPSSIDDIPVPSAEELAELDSADDAGSTEEEQKPKGKKQQAAAADDAEAGDGEEGDESDEADDQAGDETEEGDDTEESDDESEDEADPKERNRDGYLQRTKSQIRGEVTQKLDEIAKPQTAEQLQEAGYDPAMAEVESIRQEMQRDKVIAYVTDLNTEMNIDSQNVVKDFPVYDEKSPEYDEGFAKDVENRYKQAAKLRTDPSGEFVTNAEIPLYDFYSWAAKLRGSGVKKGRTQGQKAAERMLGAAETPSSSAPKASTESKDPFLQGLLGKGNHN